MIPPKAVVRSWPALPPKAMSGSMALQQRGSVSDKDQGDVPSLSMLPSGVMLMSEGCDHSLPTSLLWRAGAAPCLGSTIKLVLLV